MDVFKRIFMSPKNQDLVAEIFLHYVLPSFNAFLITGITLTTAKLRLGQGLHLGWCYFFPMQIVLNWVQFIRNRSIVPTSPESFPGITSKLTFNDQISLNINNQEVRYKACHPCGMYVPIRSHHCPYCRKCIYVLDHHCFFLGYCVGRQNMKYFVMFCVYAALGTGYGVYHIMDVMTYYRDVSGTESIYFFFPFILVMYIMERAAGFEVYYVFLIDFGLGAIIISTFLASMGTFSVLNGSTPYEDKRNIKVEEKDGMVGNFLRVFGRHGLLHLVFPVLPFPEARVDKGYTINYQYNQARQGYYTNQDC